MCSECIVLQTALCLTGIATKWTKQTGGSPREIYFMQIVIWASCLKTNILWNINNHVNSKKLSYSINSLKAVFFSQVTTSMFRHQSSNTITFSMPFQISQNVGCSLHYFQWSLSQTDWLWSPFQGDLIVSHHC